MKRKPGGERSLPFKDGRDDDAGDENAQSDFVFGRNAVLSFLEQMERNDEKGSGKGKDINKVFMADGLDRDVRLDRIQRIARDHRIPVVTCDKRKLDQMLGRAARHQGIACQLSPAELVELPDFIDSLKSKPDYLGTNPMVVVVDGIEDPHNLGAIIRVSEAAGAQALLLPVRRAAQITGTVSKVSAGALASLTVVRVHNLVKALDELKEAGFWVAGLDVRGEKNVFESDLKRPLAIVVGSEHKGLSRLVSENCDFHVKIPMLGLTESLNASVASGIVLFEAVRQRMESTT